MITPKHMDSFVVSVRMIATAITKLADTQEQALKHSESILDLRRYRCKRKFRNKR